MKRGAQRTQAKARRPATRPARKKPAPGPPLQRRLAAALEQQAATSEILRVIASSPNDVQPVFDAIVASAARLCEAEFSAVSRFDPGDGLLHLVALNNLSVGETEAFHSLFPRPPAPNFVVGRAFMQRRPVQLADVLAEPGYDPRTRQVLQRVARHRTFLGVPIMRNGTPIGVIGCARRTVKPFTDAEIELVKTFADQAVIAIENVRLFTEAQAHNRELTESLEQQTATAEILRVISSSPTDVQPVFEAISAAATALCAAQNSGVFLFDGTLIHLAAHHNWTAEDLEAVREAFPRPPGTGSVTARAILTRAVAHTPDIANDPAYEVAGISRAGFRTVLSVPMLRDGEPIGAITVTRREPVSFTERQVALLQTFADQAVIAVENVRLFQALDARNGALTESLEQQTATAEILQVISSSPTDVQPVFDTIVRSAARLCDGDSSFLYRYDGRLLNFAAHQGLTPEGYDALAGAWPRTPNSDTGAGRSILDRRIAHIPDVQADPGYALGDVAQLAAFRAVVAVPMLRDGVPIGSIAVNRVRSGAFTERQIELLKTFADQAVIAIENVRLFTELDARNSALTESLDQQTATSEILRVISSSPTDVRPVFDTIVTNAVALCAARMGAVYRFDGELSHLVAYQNYPPEVLEALLRMHPRRPQGGLASDVAILTREVAQIEDTLTVSQYPRDIVAPSGGFRSVLAVPMLRDGEPIGVIVIARAEPGRFSEGHVELLKTFADQAVIAVESGRLFRELEARTQELTRSVGELRALGEVSQAVSSTLDLETVLATIVSRAVQLSSSAEGIVYEFDQAAQTFAARATHQISEEHLDALRKSPVRLGEGAVGRAGVSREPVQVADIEAEWQLVAPQVRSLHVREGMRSLLAIPLVREDHLLGGLVILRRERGAFSPEIVAMLQTFATQSVLAIHNARLFDEIQRQKQYADALVQTSPVAITTLDLAGAVVGWNPAAERLFGYTQTEAIGRPLEALVATPDAREEVRAGIRQGVRLQTITQRARKDGTLVDVEISAMPVLVDGEQVGHIAIYHDITELLRARREAEAANEAKSAFLATMSHEIRTPMNAVIGMSGLLLNTPLNDEQREYAEVVRQSGDALLTVINDILDFSKIEAGRLELESQPFDLRECIESTLDLVATRAAEKGLDLAYLIGERTPAGIVGDVTRLRQVLLNLLSNAVKFTERGEIVLAVGARRLHEAEAIYELTFSVRDTGIGIPPDRIDRLFQSFSQVDASTTRRYGGTGLGLAISQRLTELMGGRIAVTSRVGVGSEFRFTIRAAEGQPPATTRRDLSGVQPALRGKRVLVVDDNATNRRILTAHLHAWGVQAQAIESPVEAVAWVRGGERFDVGVLDMHMPVMDGVDLAHAIRAHLGDDTPPLILFTSLGRREARAEDEGFAAYLSKPIKPSQLFDALVSVLPDPPAHVPQRGSGRSEVDPDMARRHPLRILLAEDNVVNQKLALRVLAQMGYRADLAANGLEAIDAVERQTYDVVLMDVQMPELDGLEASREINRRWPGDGRPRIVAMTANAMQGDRELCMAAGMDDYVAKPVRVEELVAALERCGYREEAAERAAATAVDRAVLERLVATMGAPFVAELIDTFVRDGRELVDTLRRALADGNVGVFRRAAHSLKSTGESLGAGELASQARELEMLARKGTLDGARERLGALAARYDATARALEDLRRDLSA